jgi:hypothetical protein
MVTESEFRAIMMAATQYEADHEEYQHSSDPADRALYREWKEHDRLISRFAARWFDATDKR